MIVEVRLFVDRRGVCRRIDVSIPVFAAWGIPVDHVAARSTDRRIVVFPLTVGQEQHQLTLNEYGLGVAFHFDLLDLAYLYIYRGSLKPLQSRCVPS